MRIFLQKRRLLLFSILTASSSPFYIQGHLKNWFEYRAQNAALDFKFENRSSSALKPAKLQLPLWTI